MPVLILLYANGTVERLPLTDLLLEPWTASEIEALLTSVCATIERPPASCRITVRWLPDGRVTFAAIGSLGSAWLDAIPVETGAVRQALGGLA